MKALFFISILCFFLLGCVSRIRNSTNVEKDHNPFRANYKVPKPANKDDSLQYKNYVYKIVQGYANMFGVRNVEQSEKKETIRFMWIRAFDEPVCIQIDKNEEYVNLLLRVNLKTSSISGRPVFGERVIDTTFAISMQQWQELNSMLKNEGFWEMKETYFQILGCADGAQWILEGKMKDTPYHFVSRDCSLSEEKGLIRCCKYILDLSGYEVPKSKMY